MSDTVRSSLSLFEAQLTVNCYVMTDMEIQTEKLSETSELSPRKRSSETGPFQSICSDLTFKELFALLDEAQQLEEQSKKDCPVHNGFEPASIKPAWLKTILKGLQLGAICSYVLCPPLPRAVVDKLLFCPPPRSLYYYIVSGEGSSRQAHFSAATAHRSPRPLSLCLPYMISPHTRCFDVLLHLQRIKVDTIATLEGSYLCVIIAECEKSARRMRPLGVPRSPSLVIFSQPNSSDIGMCMFTDPNIVDIADFMQCDVLTYDYSGYGVSSGTASERSMYADIDAVWKYATENLGYAAGSIMLIGFSIGTAASSYLAAQHPQIGGLVLIAPFTSFLRVLSRKPQRNNTCRYDKFPTVERAPAIKCKTLICHGTDDTMIRYEHSVELSRRIPNAGTPVMVKATHQGIFCDRSMWESVRSFILLQCGVSESWKNALRDTLQAKHSKSRTGNAELHPWKWKNEENVNKS